MTPSLIAIVLIKTLWMHGIISDVEPNKWVRPAEPKITVTVETSMDQCVADGEKWKLDILKVLANPKMEKKLKHIPVDNFAYQCDIVLTGGTTV